GPAVAAEQLLEAEDELILIDRIDMMVDFRAQVADGAGALRGVDRADLRTENRNCVVDAVALLDVPAVEAEKGAPIEERAALLDVDDVGDRQEIASGVAEQFQLAFAGHVPGEAGARREHVVGLDVAATFGVLVVE